MTDPEAPAEADRQVEGYRRMLVRAATALRQAAGKPLPSLRQLLEAARHSAVELRELSKEEAERVAHYLRRDLLDAAAHLRASERELADWLRFDAELVEERLLEFFAPLVDRTRLELERLAMEADLAGWHSGEVTGPGTLQCEACGQPLLLRRTARIPPCPKCKGSRFHRRRPPKTPAP